MSNLEKKTSLTFLGLFMAAAFFSISARASDLEARNQRREQIQKAAESLVVVPPEAGLVRAPKGLLSDALDAPSAAAPLNFNAATQDEAKKEKTK